MLAESMNAKQYSKYALDDEWWFEQKIDGVRFLLHIDNGVCEGWNRQGNGIPVHPAIQEAAKTLNGNWVLDGEWLDRVLYCFDVPYAGDFIRPEYPYELRRTALETIFDSEVFAQCPQIVMLPVARNTAEKIDLHRRCRDNHSEGIMSKFKSGTYLEGVRSRHVLKCKFVDTCEVIVAQVGRQGKRSIACAMFDNGGLIDVGAVTVTEARLKELKIGDVIEVRYLYATKDRRLYQPAFVRIRDDKTPQECTVDQLKIVNKQVLVA